MSKAVVAFAISVLAMGDAHAASSVSTTLSIQVNPQALVLVVNPATVAGLACEAKAGAAISQASASGGNGNPVTYSMTPANADFAINPATGAIAVGPSGITQANCNKTFTFTVIGTQP